MKRHIIIFTLSIFLVSLLIMACEEKYDNNLSDNIFSSESQSSCEGCHLNKELLAKVAEPLDDDGGESGEG